MADGRNFELRQDKKGVIWDALLYVPTVGALGTIALSMWYSGSEAWAYLLSFLACFFAIVGFNRIAGGRLMLLPASPTQLEILKKGVTLKQRNGERVDLVKEVRFFADYANKSFGLTGLDLNGKKRQYVFYRGQFADEAAFKDARSLLNVYR